MTDEERQQKQDELLELQIRAAKAYLRDHSRKVKEEAARLTNEIRGRYGSPK